MASDIDEKITDFSPFTIRGRQMTPTVLEESRGAIETYWHAGRSVISQVLCEQWNWRRANGHLKDMACRELLHRLERLGLIALPPRRSVKINYRRISPLPPALALALCRRALLSDWPKEAAFMTREEARRLYRRGEEATVEEVLLALSAEIDELKARLHNNTARKKPASNYTDVVPATPSGMIAPDEKASSPDQRHRRSGRKHGHPGACRRKPERIDRFQEHKLGTG